jgi:hypothetical protein
MHDNNQQVSETPATVRVNVYTHYELSWELLKDIQPISLNGVSKRDLTVAKSLGRPPLITTSMARQLFEGKIIRLNLAEVNNLPHPMEYAFPSLSPDSCMHR